MEPGRLSSQIQHYECFISDESSLSDFGEDTEETLEKINRLHDLDLKEIGDGNIVRFLTLIKEKRQN